jgi:hypothetical protein
LASLENFIQAAFVLFGSPLVLAEKAWLRMAEYKRARDWLYRCEELFRRLLYVDTRALPAVGNRQSANGRNAIADCRPPTAFNSEHPEAWRATFQLTTTATRSRARTRKPAVDWRTTACAYGLARRLEALIRAVKNPERHVRRMARLLRKRPQLAKLFAQPPRTYQTTRTTSGDFTLADAATFIRETDSS